MTKSRSDRHERSLPQFKPAANQPTYANLAEGLAAADAAFSAGGADAALAVLAELADRFPSEPEPFFRASRLCKEAGRLDDADRFLELGQRQCRESFGFYLGRAWLAHERRNFDAAVERWDELRQAFPDHPAGYHGAAVSLREAGRLDEAERIAAAGYDRHPNNSDIADEHARAVSMRRDFAVAVERWTTIVERFPDRPRSHIGLALALRELGRPEDADATLRIAVERFPEDRSTAIEYAFLAQIRRDWPEAARRWGEVRQRTPDHHDAYLLGAGALRLSGEVAEAEAVLLAAGARFPANPAALIEYARSARDRGDHAEAVRRCERLRGAFPDNAEGYLGGIAALSALRREPESELLLAATIARFPANLDVLREYAQIALRREDWAVAGERFGRLRERFPEEPAGYFGGAEVLQHQGRIAEAEALLEAGMTRLPDNPYLALQHALLATHVFVRNWDAGILRLAQLRARFAEFEPGYGTGIRVLREAGRMDEAEALALDAQARFPGRFEPALEHARIALEREDWDQAVQRFTRLTEAFGDEAGAYVGLAQALSRGGRLDEAEAVLRGAMGRFPGEVAPFAEYGLVAIRRNDWKAALERAEEAQRRFPNAPGLTERVFEARLRLAESDPAAIDTEADGSARSSGDAGDPQTLMMRFESIGGSGHGCEFGLVQRKFGAEPLGLLRWADLGGDAEGLIGALNTEFAGIGEPEHTELITLPNGGRNEYWTRDRRYWMAMRAFIFEDEIPRDKMYAQACRRLQYLRRKLVEDLRDGSKIFVYKNMWRNLTDEELARLHTAMRGYGDNTLLYVRFEEAGHLNGTVTAPEPGLMVGYIDHFAFSPKDEPMGDATFSWVALCREALRLRDTAADDSSSRKFG